jgi:hypothetical protein
MEEEKPTNLTKFPNAEKANREAPATGLPSAFDLFKPSVRVLQNNLAGFLVLLGVPAILMLIGQGSSLWSPPQPGDGLFPDGPLAMFFGIGWILSILMTPALILLQLRGTRKEALTWQDAFSRGLKFVPRIFGLAILTTVILSASLAVFIIPFFLVLPRIIMASYYLVDQNLGIIEALKTSWNNYKAFKGIWGVLGVIILLCIPSFLPVIGWLIGIVLTLLYSVAPAIRYEQIKRLSADKSPRTPIEEEVASAA